MKDPHTPPSSLDAARTLRELIVRQSDKFRREGFNGGELYVMMRDFLADSGRAVAIPLLDELGIKPEVMPAKLSPGPKFHFFQPLMAEPKPAVERAAKIVGSVPLSARLHDGQKAP